MTLPKHIQEQADEADRIEAELAAASNPAPAEPQTPEPVQEVEPVAEPVTPPVPEPTPETPPEPKPDDTWERRFKSLQGKYNAEVPRLHEQLRELKHQIQELAKAPKAPVEPEKPLVNEKDVETFGSDLIDVIDRKAREVAGKMVNTKTAELEAENRQLREKLDGVAENQTSYTRQAYLNELARQVPDWEAVNVDPGFIDWLSEVDSLSGHARQDYLNSAYQSGDVGRTVALFSAYKQLTAPPPAPARKELEKQVAPGTSKVSSAAPTANETKIWTQAEIAKFYTDVAKGKYGDKPQEAQRIENEIDLAAASGRVR